MGNCDFVDGLSGSSLDNSDQHGNDSQDQEYVYQSTNRVGRDHSKYPQDEQNESDCIEHLGVPPTHPYYRQFGGHINAGPSATRYSPHKYAQNFKPLVQQHKICPLANSETPDIMIDVSTFCRSQARHANHFR